MCKSASPRPNFAPSKRPWNAETLIPFADAGCIKFDILNTLYASFRERHLAKNTERAKAFQAYVGGHGGLLERFALFHALQEHFHQQDDQCMGLACLAEAYQDPDSPLFRNLSGATSGSRSLLPISAMAGRIAARRGQARCAERNLGIGLYMDMAVGVDRGGADVWANQRLFAQSSAVGAPPDEYNQKGQDWGLPPFIPERMREEQYQSFIEILRAKYAPCRGVPPRSRHGPDAAVLDSAGLAAIPGRVHPLRRVKSCSAFSRWKANATVVWSLAKTWVRCPIAYASAWSVGASIPTKCFTLRRKRAIVQAADRLSGYGSSCGQYARFADTGRILAEPGHCCANRAGPVSKRGTAGTPDS